MVSGYGLGGFGGFSEPWGSILHGLGITVNPPLLNRMYRALLPPGSLWKPKVDGYFDQWIWGKADNFAYLHNFLSGLAFLRDPNFTPILEDLEKEFGVVTDTAISESIRRQQLAGIAYAVPGGGSLDDLQDALTAAGFDATVYANDPIIDPSLVISDSDLLVNGENIETQGPAYLMQAGGAYTAGNTNAVAGYFQAMTTTTVDYKIPTDPRRWNFIFFIGGTRPVPTTINPALIPAERRMAFEKIILKYKPDHSWAGLVVTYI